MFKDSKRARLFTRLIFGVLAVLWIVSAFARISLRGYFQAGYVASGRIGFTIPQSDFLNRTTGSTVHLIRDEPLLDRLGLRLTDDWRPQSAELGDDFVVIPIWLIVLALIVAIAVGKLSIERARTPKSARLRRSGLYALSWVAFCVFLQWIRVAAESMIIAALISFCWLVFFYAGNYVILRRYSRRPRATAIVTTAATLGMSIADYIITLQTLPRWPRLSILLFMLLATLLVSALLLVAPFVIRSVILKRRHLRRRIKACRKCGYSLIGNTSGLCPECGTPTASPA